VKAGAAVSITVRQDATIRTAIQSIDARAWTTIDYPQAVWDEATGAWISRAEVAEVPFTAFSSAKRTEQVSGRLVVRRILDLNPPADPSQASLFEVFRFHAFFTTVPIDAMDTVTADKTHRQHAIIEQVFADLKASALAHLPSGSFAANSAWLVLASIAFNLTRAIGTIAGGTHARATTATIRRRLIAIPARIASSARRLTMHLPNAWPWQQAWQDVFDKALGPCGHRVDLTDRRTSARPPDHVEQPGQTVIRRTSTPTQTTPRRSPITPPTGHSSVDPG